MIAYIFNFVTLRSFAVTRKRKLFLLVALAAAVALSIYDRRLVDWLDNLPYLSKVLELVLFGLSVYVVASAFRMIIVSRYRKRNDLDREDNDNFTIGASTLVGTVTAVATIIGVFAVFEIEFYTFLTSIALFSVALAAIFKDTVQDFVEGLSILFTARYKVGDYVQVGSHPRGLVIDITLSKMLLRLEDGSVLYLSNHAVNGTPVINFSAGAIARVAVVVNVPKEIVFKDLTEKITAQLKSELPDLVQTNKTTFSIQSVGTDTYSVQCNVATSNYSFTTERKIKNAVQLLAGEMINSNASKKTKSKKTDSKS